MRPQQTTMPRRRPMKGNAPMTLEIRIAVAIGLLLALAGLATLPGWRSAADSGPTAAAGLTNADCQRCHQDVWDQWEQSLHSQSWVSDSVQAAFAHFGHDRKCESCHAPRPIFVVGITEPVELRSGDRDSGVDCLTCHQLPSGQIAARRTLADAPCRPIATGELTASLHCSGCHVAIFEDWQQSRYATAGTTCQSCHMPAETLPNGAASHMCLGGHDDALVRSGVELDCTLDDGQLVVSVTNHATGHNFPGERHNRVLLLEIVERTAAGDITLAEQKLIKGITPFRGESSSEMLRPDQTFTARVEIVRPAVTARVQLLYKRFPWMPVSEALVVHQREIELP